MGCWEYWFGSKIGTYVILAVLLRPPNSQVLSVQLPPFPTSATTSPSHRAVADATLATSEPILILPHTCIPPWKPIPIIPLAGGYAGVVIG